MQKLIKVRKIIFLFFLIMPKSFVIAGSLDSPEDVGHQQSTMYTLSDIYNRLHSGTEGALSDGGFVEPASGPASSGYDLNDIMQIAPQTDDSNGAEIINVLETTTFWGVKSSNWGLQSGTMKNIGQQQVTPTISEQIISQGYHDGTGVVAGDADLLTANIKAGITIFDIEGKKEVVDTSSGDAVAAEIIKDKKAWVDGVEVIGTQSVQTLNNINEILSAGSYEATTLSTVDTDLSSDNIKKGINIFGITGNDNVVDTGSGDAVAEDIIKDKKAWVDGVEVIGTQSLQTLNNISDILAAGSYEATTLSTVDTDLSSDNIKKGINIFGI
ncbi:MAG: hypothetical protein KZQ83_09105, partial [gamma proteobacterium symbiont of Taylorina sp.]|nr:hypothetical protein [gamma proteobacterium symbiont of Taylorina sp.]